MTRQSGWGKRRLNQVWTFKNRLGEYFVFGRVGTGKDRTIVTLAARRDSTAIQDALKKYERYVGDLMNDVPQER